MKSFKVLFLVIVSGILISLSGCHKPNPTPPTDEEVQLGKLKQTWKVIPVKGVTLDGVDKTVDYKNFSLVISGTPEASSFQYTTSGRPATSPWLGSGTWVFGTDPLADIIRDKGTTDELAMKYSVNDTQLQISFTFAGTGYQARTAVVKGAWIYTFQL